MGIKDKTRVDHTADDNFPTESERFHAGFDFNVRELMEPVRDALIESVNSCSRAEIIAQLLMNELCDEPMTVGQKARLVCIADHLGPDCAQALYHVAVFITKVA